MPEGQHPDEEAMLRKMFEKREPRLQPFPERVMAFKFIAEDLQIKPDIVYYPGCATDISPVEGFPGSKVTFVDKDQQSTDALQKAGHNAVCADAASYTLENRADVIILINSGVAPDGPVANLKHDGYVICNDHHSAATNLKGNPEFILVGVGDLTDKGQSVSFEKENSDLYWETVDTDEEFKTKNPWLFENFKKLVERYTGKTENIVDEYQKLYEKFYDPAMEAGFDFDTHTAFPPLPRKVGGKDSFFVYRKRQQDKGTE